MLVRCGETQGSEQGRLTGTTDLPLSPLGDVHGNKAGEFLMDLQVPTPELAGWCTAGCPLTLMAVAVQPDVRRPRPVMEFDSQQLRPAWLLCSDHASACIRPRSSLPCKRHRQSS